MSDIAEASLAIEAVRENTGLEIICTFTFEKNANGEYRTMMGVSPAEMASACVAAGANIIGSNCGNGFEQMPEITAQIRKAAPQIPIIINANAGMPVQRNGITVFPETPAMVAGFVPALVSAGANIIGGCCGTTPEHITAIAGAVRGLG
jgi:5-methyltetrahydrofolate--homocysteine methyltransferase